MNLFKNNRLANKISVNQLNEDIRNGWYPREDFFALLRKEQHHCARNKLPISCITFDLSTCLISHREFSKGQYKKFLKEIMKFITDYSRDYDIKSLCSSYFIAIVLMDASLEDTKSYIEKKVNKMYDHFIGLGKTEYLRILEDIKISSYPLYQMNPLSKFETTLSVDSNISTKERIKNLQFVWDRVNIEDLELIPTSNLLENLSAQNNIGSIQQCTKRLIDIVGSLIGLITFSIIMLIIALAIKLTSRGPIFYKQKRAGYLGLPFNLFKFRSMYHNIDKSSHKDYIKKLVNTDPKKFDDEAYREKMFRSFTPIGKLLRKTSIDELPQLFNILRGDMSLVGPRPHPYYEVEYYKDWYNDRLTVKPGLTGLSKILIRDSAKDYSEAMRKDIWYLRNWSLQLDFKIIFKTFSAVLVGRDAL